MVAKKSADESFTVQMSFDRETKRTYRYVADIDAYITMLYVEKTAFSGKRPREITVTVTTGGE